MKRTKDVWNLLELRTNVAQRYGENQALEVWDTLQSIRARFQHAKLHIEEFKRLENEVVSGRTSTDLIKEIFRFSETRVAEISVTATAHALGAVQSLHSLTDILGAAIMLSLTSEKSWNGYFYQIKLASEHLSLQPLMQALNSDDSYTYLADLTNRSKHRTVVSPIFRVDATGAEKNRYDFLAFEHKGRAHGSREVKAFLIHEFDRQGIAIHRIGNELNRLTK